MPKIVDRRARAVPLAVALLMAGPFACSETLTAGTAIESEGGPGIFSPPEAGSAPEPDAGLIAYCATSACPGSLSTCPNSRFACDVDLETDRRNCGSCGFTCNSSLGTNASFDCIEGRCAMTCEPNYADCNGVVDDDCEIKLGTNDNCNGCGDKCPDPEKPCIFDTGSGKGKCGCDPGLVFCIFTCVDPTTADWSCGSCGNACDPTGPGATPHPHMFYGCAASTCGHAKCDADWANCDGDVENGCEANLLSNESCGACGKVCAPGQKCIRNRMDEIECACPAGQTLCGNECVDVLTNPRNCGSCGLNCLNSSPESSGIAFCSFGSCNYGCAEGRGDCNGDSKDGCETSLASDPRNCGACGHTCDLAIGQPCVRGQCAVEACDGGVVPR